MSATNPPARAVPLLVAGQRLEQATFHANYEAMPPGTRAELIGGVVNLPGPVGPEHGRTHVAVIVWLDFYAEATPGVEALDNTSTALDEQSEPQPDALLRILREHGGRTHAERRFIAGAPELVVEVAKATRFVDLGPKLADYERAEVRGYVVCALDPDEVLWHVLRDGRLETVSPDADGLYRSAVFPGLWLDTTALFAGNRPALRAALQRGLETPEHSAFVARLAAARTAP